MNEAINIHSVNQHHKISIEYFPIEFHIEYIYDCINKQLDGMNAEREQDHKKQCIFNNIQNW